MSHAVDRALERLSPVARADVAGLPGGQLGGARRTPGESISATLT